MSACPICNHPAAPRSENGCFPFCSARCKQIDLGKWLSGDYRIPTDEQHVEDDEMLAAGNRKEMPS
jgi:endogenous inhibitor of DNA gyrase (YacG/DUF329 family)